VQGRGKPLLFAPGARAIRSRLRVRHVAALGTAREPWNPIALLVPLLACDEEAGARLWRGFYDCTLSGLRARRQ